MRTIRPTLAVLICWYISFPTAVADEPLFSRHVTPVLYKLGCSAGQCHGAFAGKGGFRLSLFASDARADYENVMGYFNRRVSIAAPAESLILLKPTGATPHAGGLRLKPDSHEFQILKKWIASGARYDPDSAAKVVAVQVQPSTFVLPINENRSVKVLAQLSDGSREDVTPFVRFESLDPSIAKVDAHGTVTGQRSGDAPILAFYAGKIGYAHALSPGKRPANLTFPKEDLKDPVDRLIVQRLKELNIVPSPTCTDLEFLRRVYLDTIGMLPTPTEIRSFLNDTSADKRAKLIDRLLEHPYHAAMWAGKLCDMIGADDRFLGNNVYQFHDWFRNKFEKNTPWDQIAYGVICSTAADDRDVEELKAELKRQAEERRKKKKKKNKSETNLDPNIKPWHTGYATRKTLDVFYNNLINKQVTQDKKRIVDSKKVALRVAHTYLGVRLECAQCHKHPHDRWTQADFFGFAAAFSYVDFGVDPELKAKKVNFRGTHVTQAPMDVHLHPKTGEKMAPHILGGPEIDMKAGADPRRAIWEWMMSAKNPYFARAIVNRIWAHYLGRGFVDPPDDFSSANPPSHPEVLDELARDFIKHRYDLRYLHRRILNTTVYQRSWKTNVTNSKDQRNYSHFNLRRLTAEQALDALAQITGTPVKVSKRYAKVRDNVKAVELALSRVSGEDAYVLQIFGRPRRIQNCDCERSSAISLSQVLYLYNDEKLLEKISDPKGRLPKLVASIKENRKLIEELYLWTLTRFPEHKEMERSVAHIKETPSRSEAFEDIVWSLLNRDEFLLQH